MRLNRNSKLLLYGSNIWYFGEGMLGPLFAIFTERIGGDVLQITWAWATYLIVTGFLVLLVGRIVDGSNIKAKVMVAGYALNAIFTFGYLFVSSPWHLFIVQAGLGVSAALAMPTWDALYAKYENKKHDALHWSLVTGEGQVFTGLAVIIGGFIVTYYSFTALFITMGMIQVIATIYQAQILFKK